MTYIGGIIVLFVLVNTSVQSIDENYLHDSMQSPVVKSYERHLNEMSLRIHGRPAVVRGRVKQYRCVEEYIPSVEDLEDSVFDPSFIQNEDTDTLRRYSMKRKFPTKNKVANIRSPAKHFSNSMGKRPFDTIAATNNNIYGADSISDKDIPIETRQMAPHAQSVNPYARSPIHPSVTFDEAKRNAASDLTINGISQTTPPQNIFLKLKWPFA